MANKAEPNPPAGALKTFPSPETLRRLPFGLADVAVTIGTLLLLAVIVWAGDEALQRFRPPDVLPTINLDPRNLPSYAAHSTLRMFVALLCSLVFTIVYGYIAANSPRAERVMIPLLDILQSVPVLGFLSITVNGFIALFPGSLLGLEAASIFAIFTSQVWNMTFSFYQSMRTIPPELEEAVTLYRLSGWQRLIRLQIPAAAIGLLWNAMMSFGGGWFFLAASEAISVLNQRFTLPGVGSYVAAAIAAKDRSALIWAVITIATVILLVDQLFWRPLIAWADKFRIEQSAAAEAPQSWIYDLIRAARLPHLLEAAMAPVKDAANRFLSLLTPAEDLHRPRDSGREGGDVLYDLLLLASIGAGGAGALHFLLSTLGIAEVVHAAWLGLLTQLRVIVLLLLASLLWTPIGVAIGFHPILARRLQPVVQFLASFPANFIFPFATLVFIHAKVSMDLGSILLMALGAQWYILFNSIAGAQSIPTDLREMGENLHLKGWQRWQRLIIPGIFSAWVTGAVTASGGAWNASIVAEVVSWGSTSLQANGLGAYIARATTAGDWPRIALGIGMMCLFVVAGNRLLWRRLYRLAETKYHL